MEQALKLLFAGKSLVFLFGIVFNMGRFELFFHVFGYFAATAAFARTTLCGALCKVLKQPVQTSMRLPSTVVYCKLGYFRVQFVGL